MTEYRLIRLAESIPHAPEMVWKALTIPAFQARWWAAGDVRPVVGHRFDLDMGPWGRQACEVLEVQPGRLLRYTFAAGTLDTTITWKLEPREGGTLLHLEHGVFNLDTPMGKKAYEGMKYGWPTVLERIAPALGEVDEFAALDAA